LYLTDFKTTCRELKEQYHEIFDFWFFSWISFPQAPEYTNWTILNFLKLRGDIRSSRCTNSVIDTIGKWKKSSIIKVFIILCGRLWEVELTYRYIFAFKVQFKVCAAWYCSHYLPPVS
jgi:hypothetical protein